MSCFVWSSGCVEHKYVLRNWHIIVRNLNKITNSTVVVVTTTAGAAAMIVPATPAVVMVAGAEGLVGSLDVAGDKVILSTTAGVVLTTNMADCTSNQNKSSEQSAPCACKHTFF